MTWEYFGATMLFVAIGYLIGSISWSVVISKLFAGEDVRTKGSGNAGATNVLRNYGLKTGLLVFLLDVCKPIVAVLIAFMVRTYAGGFWGGILIQAAGLAAVVGHIFPIFFKFKGGKGSASFVGFFISMQWILAVIGIFVVVLIVLKTKKVSLGSILGPIVLIALQIIFGATGVLQGHTWIPMMYVQAWWVNTIFISIIWLITTYRHKANIVRLLNRTERSLGQKK